MTPTKLLIGQMIAVLAIILAGIWAATQWAAASLQYQPELGAPWLTLMGVPIYQPWSIFPWWFSFDAYAPAIFDEAGAIAAGSGLLACSTAIFGSVWRARQSSNVTTYGSARWASRQETARALLTPGEVMQLAPTDELLLISGHPPIRAKKLRYYEDRRFAARVLPAPAPDAGGYRDIPARRPDDWAGQVRATDLRLADEAGNEEGADSGGFEQTRHPAHEIEPVILAEPDVADPLGLGEEDGDQAAERRVLDRVQAFHANRVLVLTDAS